jgi:hypothetical protein
MLSRILEMDINNHYSRNKENIDVRWGLMITVIRLLSPNDIAVNEYDGKQFYSVWGHSKFAELAKWARYGV